MSRYRDDHDVANLLDDMPSGPTDHSARKPKRPRGEGRRSAYEKVAEKAPPRRGVYDHLAMVFRDAPCFVSQGAPLLAKLLQERAEKDDRIVKHMSTGERREDALIQDIVEYMIRRFWERVPNDERGNPLHAFLSAEWWEVLVEESIDHQKTLRIPETAWKPAGGWGISDDPFYNAFIGPETTRPTGTLSARLQAARSKHHTTTEESD